MTFELTGKVIDVSPVQQRSDKFRKREFVIEVAEQNSEGREFVDYIKFQCIQDRSDLIDENFLNEMVKVSFNIKGNRWEKEGKVNYFTNLDAWRIEKTQTGNSADGDLTPPPLLDDLPPENQEMDDLPF
jgi:hypothetical protein